MVKSKSQKKVINKKAAPKKSHSKKAISTKSKSTKTLSIKTMTKKSSLKKSAPKSATKKMVKASPKAKVTSARGLKTKAIKPKVVKMKSAKASDSVSTEESLFGKNFAGLTLPMTGGKVFNLKDWNGQRVVLYFYPKDMTPGCTIEGHEFTQLKEDFKKLNTEIFGISRDPIKSHEKFIEKENYKIDLLSDEQETACKMFDVIKEKNMYGKKVMGIERSTFLIDKNGNIEKEWRKVKAEGHAQEVLDYIKAHS